MADHFLDATKKADCISREAAKQRIRDSFPDLANRCEINAILNSIPAADVRVVRGKWIRGNESRTSSTKDSYICSVCGEKTLSGFCGNPAKTNFCPNCGADMREMQILDTTKGERRDESNG